VHGVHHLVPRDIVSKYELLEIFKISFNRPDVSIRPFTTQVPINRSLSTIDTRLNLQLWGAAGFPEPPYISTMIQDIARSNSAT